MRKRCSHTIKVTRIENALSNLATSENSVRNSKHTWRVEAEWVLTRGKGGESHTNHDFMLVLHQQSPHFIDPKQSQALREEINKQKGPVIHNIQGTNPEK